MAAVSSYIYIHTTQNRRGQKTHIQKSITLTQFPLRTIPKIENEGLFSYLHRNQDKVY